MTTIIAGASTQPWDEDPDTNAFRILRSPTRGITGRDDCSVVAEAVQLGDGHIGGGPDGPVIFAKMRRSAFTTAQAQELAAALLAAVADVQQWQSGGSGEPC